MTFEVSQFHSLISSKSLSSHKTKHCHLIIITHSTHHALTHIVVVLTPRSWSSHHYMQNHRHQLTCRALLQFNKQKKNNRYWNSCYALNQNRTMLALKTEKKITKKSTKYQIYSKWEASWCYRKQSTWCAWARKALLLNNAKNVMKKEGNIEPPSFWRDYCNFKKLPSK